MNADGVARPCYISGPWAYFTTQDITKQRGDDWNDAPYEHNAGAPYEPCWHRQIPKQAGCTCEACEREWDGVTPRWAISKVAWDGPLVEPSEGQANSPWSVNAINNGGTPWLRTSPWAFGRPKLIIPAGTTLDEFVRLVHAVGGAVYTPLGGPPRGAEEESNR